MAVRHLTRARVAGLMKVVVFGATGMVGMGVLLECLDDARVESALVVGRHPLDVTHPKLRSIIHRDFFDFTGIQSQFVDVDACFFCLGVSSVGMSDGEYDHQTYDLTLAAATAIASVTSRRLTFCYVSGEGTDSTERGRVAWARTKGKTENALLRLPFKAAFMFRPGYIQPLRGVRSKTRWYQALYDAVGPVYPLLQGLLPRYVTTTVSIGRAMIQVAANGADKPILRSDDINRLSAPAARDVLL
jgi:uncharacterized protein YbjT (DUF2867 family)